MRIQLFPLLTGLLFLPTPGGARIPADEGVLMPSSCTPADGKLEWFEGSWEALLKRAAGSEVPLLLGFFDNECLSCTRYLESTIIDPPVLSELRGFLALAVDTSRIEAFPLMKRGKIHAAPVLLFLEPSGEILDRLDGYLKTPDLMAELQRIRRGEGTLKALRQAVEEAPEDLDALYRLALKLSALRDKAGYQDQIQTILRLDPKGEHIVSRRLRLSSLRKQVEQTLKLDSLYEFLGKETEGELLYEGWYVAWRYERHLASASRWKKATGHAARWMRAARELWAHVPDEERAKLGNRIAWAVYEERKRLAPADHAFARDVAAKAALLSPEDPYVLDTLACCLWMVGEKKEAHAWVARCIELDPSNPQWRKRIRELR